MPDTTKGAWRLQEIRDQIIAGQLSYCETGTLWVWGTNVSGSLGINSTALSYYSSPVQVPGTQWIAGVNLNSADSNLVVARKSDGTLWMWGYNTDGGLGQDDRTHRSSPVQVPGTQWLSGSQSKSGAAAIKCDGTLWSWGYNLFGELGQGNTIAKSSPVQIPGTQWLKVLHTSSSVHGIKSDCTLWTWGYNGQGQLGKGDTISYSSPVIIGGGPWTNIFTGHLKRHALKSDGTLWAWGYNYHGQLGVNNITFYSSPVQVPGTQWVDVSGSQVHTVARKTDGTLWVWGRNCRGQLGLNNTDIWYSSPVQIPGTQWICAVAAGVSNTVAIKSDRTLWVWGSSQNGMLGNNTSGNYSSISSPIQLPGTVWNVTASSGHVFTNRG